MTASPHARLPEPGTYRVRRTQDDAVARARLRTVAGPVDLRFRVLAAAVGIAPEPGASWIELDLDTAGVVSSVPPPVRRAVSDRVGRTGDTIRLEVFGLRDTGDARLRARAEVYVGERAVTSPVTCRITHADESGLRLAVTGRVSRSALGLTRGGRLVADTVRFVLALHASVDALERAGTAA